MDAMHRDRPSIPTGTLASHRSNLISHVTNWRVPSFSARLLKVASTESNTPNKGDANLNNVQNKFGLIYDPVSYDSKNDDCREV